MQMQRPETLLGQRSQQFGACHLGVRRHGLTSASEYETLSPKARRSTVQLLDPRERDTGPVPTLMHQPLRLLIEDVDLALLIGQRRLVDITEEVKYLFFNHTATT